MGVSPYIQVEGFVKEGVQLIPLALGGPGHHLGELVPGLQGELDEGVARAWWGADISPLPPPTSTATESNRGGRTHWGGWGGVQGTLTVTPQPSPHSSEGAGASPTLPTGGSATGGCKRSDLSWRPPQMTTNPRDCPLSSRYIVLSEM